MALKPLNSIAGFSVGESPTNVIINNVGNITAPTATITGVTNLNSISNVIITGGSAGQVITTDGNGNLSFATVDTATLSNGTSNVKVLNNGNILFNVGENPNVVVVTGTGENVNGYLTVTGNGTFGNVAGGNLVSANYVSGTLTTAAQPNITSVGTLTSLDVSGALSAASLDASTGNVKANAVYTNNLLYANGATWDLQQAAGQNNYIQYNEGNNFAASANFQFDPTTSTLSVTGTANVDGQLNVTGNIKSDNANLGNLATANYFAGVLTTAAQPNITSVGTLTDLTVSGNASAGNLSTAGALSVTGNANVGNLGTAGSVSATGNVSGGNLTTSGMVSATGNISGGNISTTGSVSATGDVSGATGTFSGNVNVGNLITGNGSGGTISGAYSVTANYFIGDGSNLANIAGANVTGTVANANYAAYAGNVVNAAQPNITSVGTLTGLSVDGSNVTLANGAFVGNGAGLTNLNGASVTGQVANALVAGTVYTAAQPNITSVGTLTSLDVSGNLSGNTANFSGNVSVANLSTGGVSATGNVSAGNVSATGNVSAQNLSASANLSAGNASVTGDLSGNTANFTGNVSVLNLSTTDLTASGTASVTGEVAANTANLANGLTIVAGGASIGGDINQTGNLNITGDLNVTGNITQIGVQDLVVEDPLIYIGNANPGDNYDLGIVASYVQSNNHLHTGIARNHNNSTWTFFDNLSPEPNTTINWANAQFANFAGGNLFVNNNANISGNVRANGQIRTNADLYVDNGAYINGANTTLNRSNLQVWDANVSMGGLNTTFAFTAENSNVFTITSANNVGNVSVTGQLNVSANANVGNLNTTAMVASGNASAANFNTAGQVVATGNISGGNISTAGNLTAVNLVTGGTSITAANVTTTSTSTANLATVPGASGAAVEFVVKGVNGADGMYSVATVLAVTDGGNVDYTIFGGCSLGSYIGPIDVVVSGGNLVLQVTPSSANSTVWTTQYRLI